MAEASVAADLGEALDVKRDGTAKIALNYEVVVNAFTELGLFLFGQVFNSGVRIDTGHFKNLGCAGSANSVDIGKSDFYTLVLRQVNAGYTCHIFRSSFRIIVPAFADN